MELRPHQIKFGKKLHDILKIFNIAYLFGEVRSNKTGTALYCAELFGAKKVLILTKKKAISSIESDYNNFGFKYDAKVINYESLHKISDKDFDLIIYDESHSLSAFPKKSKVVDLCKKRFFNTPCILMTGTASVESMSQLYHQFYVSKYSPFKEFTNFYKWANIFVNKKQKHLATHIITDYSEAKKDLINKVIKPYMIKMTQADAGFTTNITEHKIYIDTPPQLINLANRLRKDKVIEGKKGFIFGDMPAKLQSKLHQIYNGHCIIEIENDTFTKVFSTYKAEYIKNRFKGQKLAIMYYYQAELEILKKVFDLANDINEFNDSDKSIAIQQSSSEGMNLSKADAIVYYNLGFSGKNWIQSRDRMTVKERKHNDVYIICEKGGITESILNTVSKKQSFNVQMFKKWNNEK